VKHRVVFGTKAAVEQVLAACGWQINTAFIERVNLSIRQHVAAIGRRVTTLCKGEDGLLQQLAENIIGRQSRPGAPADRPRERNEVLKHRLEFSRPADSRHATSSGQVHLYYPHGAGTRPLNDPGIRTLDKRPRKALASLWGCLWNSYLSFGEEEGASQAVALFWQIADGSRLKRINVPGRRVKTPVSA
jgi:hypothetical protein